MPLILKLSVCKAQTANHMTCFLLRVKNSTPMHTSLNTNHVTVRDQPACSWRSLTVTCGFPGGAVEKNLPASVGDARDSGSIPGLGRSPEGRNDSPLQYFCLENAMDRGAWWATVHRIAESDVTELLSRAAENSVFLGL